MTKDKTSCLHMKSNSRGQLRSLNHSPVVILNPHEDVIHPLSADRWRMGHKRCDCSQNLLQLLRLQTRQDLMNDVQTNTLPGFISETQTCNIKSICHFPHITRLYMNVTQMNKPVTHDLWKVFGLEVQVDFRDDISTTQHTFKAVCLQHAMQLWQQIKHRNHKSVQQSH